jgi:hypothetical protein
VGLLWLELRLIVALGLLGRFGLEELAHRLDDGDAAFEVRHEHLGAAFDAPPIQ